MKKLPVLPVLLAAIALALFTKANDGTKTMTAAASDTPAPKTHVQGKSVEWWSKRAVQARRDANARARTITKLQTAARSKLEFPTGHWLDGAFLCIHRFEKNPNQGWQTDTGNGYRGGLQMDRSFSSTYGLAWAVREFGPNPSGWPASVQIATAIHAWTTRGFHPWPNTARYCGLL